MNSTKRVRKVINFSLAFVMALSLMTLGGCARITGSKEIELKPTIFSPAIGVDGVLRVGVDTGNHPYAALVDGEFYGIDVEVAAAIAEELGLRLELVNTGGKDLEAMFAEGSVDLVMGIEPVSGRAVKGTLIGPYIVTGPALFMVVRTNTPPVIDLDSLVGSRIAVQTGSLSAEKVVKLFGLETADPRETVDLAFRALESGGVTYVAADAVKGAVIAVQKYKNISCVKMLSDKPTGIYMAVPTLNTQLSNALTGALRTLRDNGVLKTVLLRWLDPVSVSVIMGSLAITSQDANSIDRGDDLPDPSNAGTA